jgi:hydroxyethylthiazole kinase-like uncharacterized protein yjeF
MDAGATLVDFSFLKKIFKPIESHVHKGIQGHVLLIGGSYGKIGSVCLSGKAALKSGAGLVTINTPKCGYNIVQTVLPEAMVITDEKKDFITKIKYSIKPDAFGIGMGIGIDQSTQNAFLEFIKSNPKNLLIDADGLNILGLNKEWLRYLPKNTVITPHAKELERLTGICIDDTNKLEKVQRFCNEYQVICVVKGSPTYVVTKDGIYKNTSGNQALATAGSGDVLSGIITSFLGQGYAPVEAAILGVYIHGLTAEIGVKETGYQAFIASDIINYLGKAFLTFQ